jgi:transposase
MPTRSAPTAGCYSLPWMGRLAPDWLKTLPAITTLRHIWAQQFEPLGQGGLYAPAPALPAAQLINSPYDLDARYSKKRATLWVGYKVHFTQTCDEDAPQLITHVETTRAGVTDESMLTTIHAGLAGRDLLLAEHLMDAGYLDSAHLVHSRASYAVDLIGHTLKNYCYQAETGYDLTHFEIDWEARTITCPQGRVSSSWTSAQTAKGHPVIKIKFSQTDCTACPNQAACTGQPRRPLTLQPREQMEALFAARQREENRGVQGHLSPSGRH